MREWQYRKFEISHKIGRAFGLIGGISALIATIAISMFPMYAGVSVTVTPSGERVEQLSRQTLLEMQTLEPITILFFSAIAALSLGAIYCAARAKSSKYGIAMLGNGTLLLFAAFIGGFSVGGYYLPGAAMVFVSGFLLSIARYSKGESNG